MTALKRRYGGPLSAIAVFGQSEPHGPVGGAVMVALMAGMPAMVAMHGCIYPYARWVHVHMGVYGACTWVYMGACAAGHLGPKIEISGLA